MTPRRALILAILVYAVLFAFKFVSLSLPSPEAAARGGPEFAQEQEGTGNGQKNYASLRKSAAPSPAPLAAPSVAETQKYEKIATLTQMTARFEEDRKRIESLIAGVTGITQTERTQGLAGRRTLILGIGVPPDRFDGFVERLRETGRLARYTVVKNDKTSEYLALRARRATLEKARDALLKLNTPTARVEDSLAILNHLNTIEQELQALGVSLGDFDTANELCTVRLTLVETAPAPGMGAIVLSRMERSLLWAGWATLLIGAGLAAAASACLLGVAAIRGVQALIAAKPPGRDASPDVTPTRT